MTSIETFYEFQFVDIPYALVQIQNTHNVVMLFGMARNIGGRDPLGALRKRSA